MLTPLINAIKDKYPNAKLTLVAGSWAKEVLMGNSNLDELIVFNAPWVKKVKFWIALKITLHLFFLLRKRKWDIGVEVRGDIRQIFLLFLVFPNRRIGFDFTGGNSLLTDKVPDSGLNQHILNHHIEICKYLNIDAHPCNFPPNICLTNREKAQVQSIEPYVGVHFGASKSLRRFPIEESTLLLSKIAESSVNNIIFVSSDEERYVEELLGSISKEQSNKFSIWRGTLREMILMLSRAKILHAMDSGPAHIAAALGVETIVYFGPNLPHLVRPFGRRVTVKEVSGLYCRPCDQVVCTNKIYQCCLRGLHENLG